MNTPSKLVFHILISYFCKKVSDMWQRIQTLYLAISTALIAVMLFGVKAVIPDGNGSNAEEIRYISYIPYLILLIISGLLNLLALTSCKFRVFQMRTAVLASLIILALQIWLGIDFFATSDQYVFKVSAVFPAVCIILNLLAAKNIWSDHLMVESFSHLRSRKKKK